MVPLTPLSFISSVCSTWHFVLVKGAELTGLETEVFSLYTYQTIHRQTEHPLSASFSVFPTLQPLSLCSFLIWPPFEVKRPSDLCSYGLLLILPGRLLALSQFCGGFFVIQKYISMILSNSSSFHVGHRQSISLWYLKVASDPH